MGRGFSKISLEQFKKDLVELENVEDAYNSIKMPKRSTKFSAGYDISTPFKFLLKKGESKLIPTGLKSYFNEDEALYMYIRSSLGFKYNIRMVNQVGIFESDYYNNISNEGHIFVKIQNEGDKDITFEQGERIVQAVFAKFLITDDDDADKTRIGGIGSTNK